MLAGVWLYHELQEIVYVNEKLLIVCYNSPYKVKVLYTKYV